MHRRRLLALAAASFAFTATAALAQNSAPVFRIPREAIQASLAREQSSLLQLYRELHAAPELSFQEEKTSARLAGEMRALGFEVSERIGGWGVVAVLRNGPGRTILVRTDLDGLPVREITGLPYASKARAKDEQGREVWVMHACGHDVHMACWVGAARVLASMKDRWSGTLVFIGQPAEERGAGAGAMLKDGLFTRFPKPDLCLALHDNSDIPAGQLGITPGPAMANVDSVDIIVKGLGGHGAMPHKAKDPVVLASQIVLALQTIASREISPIEPVVVTVGSIHGGTKHNIIPDEVTLQLTVRSFTMEVREKTLAAIARIARGQGIAAGLPDHLLPEVKPSTEFTPALHNDPKITARMRALFSELYGANNVVERQPMMGGEDFSRYGMTDDKIPLCLFWLGATPASVVEESRKRGEPTPALHSPFFYPDIEVALPIGVTSMSAAVLDALQP